MGNRGGSPRVEGHQEATSSSKLSLGRRLVFWASLIVGLLVVLELSSLIGLWVLEETPASAADERQMLVHEIVDPEIPRQVRSVLHPFIGYVREETGTGQGSEVPRFEIGHSVYGTVDRAPTFPARGDNQVIVAVTGGSVAQQIVEFGRPVIEERLRDAPRFAGKEIVVADLAAGGFKQPQQLMGLQYLLVLGAELDVVVNLDGFNEVAIHPFENAHSRTYYTYPRMWRSMTGVLYRDIARILGKLAFFRDLRRRWAVTFDRPWLRRSASGNLIWLVGNRLIDRRVRWAATSLRLLEEARDQASAATSPNDDEAMYARLTELWADSSIQMDRLCRANGIRYFHFLQPNQYVADSKPMGAEERQVALATGPGYRTGAERGYPLLIRTGRERLQGKVPFTDLTMMFATTRRQVYSDDCCHFKKPAAQEIAQRIADVIVAAP